MADPQLPTDSAEPATRFDARPDSPRGPRDESPTRRTLRIVAERLSERFSVRHIPKLLSQRERVRRELRSIPDRMQKLTNQATLVLDLVDDYAEGSYRAISWTSLAVAAGALLYTVSPSDVIPDVLPVLGQLDDALVIGVAMRLIRRDLRRYCEHKGYDPAKYF